MCHPVETILQKTLAKLTIKGPFLLHLAGSCKNLACIFLQDPSGLLHDPEGCETFLTSLARVSRRKYMT